MDMRKLEYFFEVARNKSFTKAAQTCFVSQTAVSQQIAILEKELGIELFVRDKKGVELTPAGETFLHGAKGAVEQYNNTVKKSREVAQGYSGILRVGFFSLFDRSVLAPILTAFCGNNPQVKMNIMQCDYESMSHNLLHGVIDVGFIFDVNVTDKTEFVKVPVKRASAGACMRKDHPLAQKDVLCLEDLEHERILTFNRNADQSRVSDFVYEKGNKQELNFNGNAYIENIDSVLLLIQAGQGVSFMPDIRGYLSDDLVFRPLNKQFLYFECNAIYKKTDVSPVLQTFMDEIKRIHPQ